MIWRAAGAVVTIMVVAAGSFLVWALLSRPAEQEQSRRDVHALRSNAITIDAVQGHGDVTILPGQAGEVRVERRLIWDRVKPTAEESWDGTRLRIAVECPENETHLFESTCRADYTVRVPADAAVEAVSEAGDLKARGTTGPLRLTTADGKVQVSDTVGDLWVRTQRGGVTATGLRSPRIDVKGGTGQISLGFFDAPTLATADLATGGIVIDVPDNGSYNVPDDGTGRVLIKVPQDPAATSTIIARIGHGVAHVE